MKKEIWTAQRATDILMQTAEKLSIPFDLTVEMKETHMLLSGSYKDRILYISEEMANSPHMNDACLKEALILIFCSFNDIYHNLGCPSCFNNKVTDYLCKMFDIPFKYISDLKNELTIIRRKIYNDERSTLYKVGEIYCKLAIPPYEIIEIMPVLDDKRIIRLKGITNDKIIEVDEFEINEKYFKCGDSIEDYRKKFSQ